MDQAKDEEEVVLWHRCVAHMVARTWADNATGCSSCVAIEARMCEGNTATVGSRDALGGGDVRVMAARCCGSRAADQGDGAPELGGMAGPRTAWALAAPTLYVAGAVSCCGSRGSTVRVHVA